MRHRSHTDEISILEVEPVELIACLFGVVHVFIYDESSTLGVVRNALADLPNKQMDS